MTFFFVSSNVQKYEVLRHVFNGALEMPKHLPFAEDTPEPLSFDLDAILREKALAAYRRHARPICVEHGGLYVEHLAGLPGPLARPFWERLAGRLCDLVPPGASRVAKVRQAVCYCDGRSRRVYLGEIDGTLADAPRGTHGLHWEPTFIPSGQTKTLAEMSLNERCDLSAIGQAWRALRTELKL